MANIINAITSGAGGLSTSADSSGIIQLQSGGTTIATISSTGITTQVGAPAFSAYNAGTQSVSANTDTKMIFNAENFDTANCFDSTTNYRFTPNVAGYYQLNASVYESGFAGSLYFLALRKILRSGHRAEAWLDRNNTKLDMEITTAEQAEEELSKFKIK